MWKRVIIQAGAGVPAGDCGRIARGAGQLPVRSAHRWQMLLRDWLGRNLLTNPVVSGIDVEARWGSAVGFFAGGSVLDPLEAAGQKFRGASDALAADFARGLVGVDHPMNVIAFSQATLRASNAIEHFGLEVKGWTITLKSPALSHYSAARVIEGAGATMKWDQPWFDISNVYGPSLNPLKWTSGFLDILCGACVHRANNLSEGVP